MTRKLETTIAQVQSALVASIPGWAETSFILDAGAAHELLALVRQLVSLHETYSPQLATAQEHAQARAIMDAAAPWLSDPE